MKFYSTNKKSPLADLKEAVMGGLAPDGGLYMPAEIPKLPPDFFKRAPSLPFDELAFEVSQKFFTPDVPLPELRTMTAEAFNFAVPLVEIDKDLWVLELFHGPTAAFKDFAARFMARLFGYFAQHSPQEVTILVATSGDTGSAVAAGFLGVKGVKVVILYPSGKVSGLQEKQLTTMGGNITALEVNGTFDDCQDLVKQAMLDKQIQKRQALASANSINIARLLPQSFYYFYLAGQLQNSNKPLVVSVPCGNFGNLTAGLIARRMGAPIDKFVAATNSNDSLPRYLKTGKFVAKPSVATISNAMDVGNPSNFARMLDLYKNDIGKMRRDIEGTSFSDTKTRRAITKVFNDYGYTMDPHGAVAYLGLQEFQKKSPGSTGVFVETASPAKFAGVVEAAIGQPVPLPPKFKRLAKRQKQSILINNDFAQLKDFLLNQ